MIHYTCDRCSKAIDHGDLRYVVRLEVQASIDLLDEGDVEEDRDHLLEIDEIIERAEAEESELVGDDVYQRQRFDLCPDCYQKMMRNPLSAEPLVQMEFSEN